MTDQSLANGIRIGGWLMIGFGAFMAACNLPSLGAVLTWLLDLVLLTPPAAHIAQPATRLLTAIAGGIVVGWGVLVLGLAGAPAETHPALIRKLLIRGYITWFLVDSAGSVLVGAPFNVIGNAAFLALLLWPLRQGRHRTAED